MARATLGIQAIHSIELAARQADPWLDFFTHGFGFQLVASSTGDAIESTGTCRRLLRCGDVRIVVAEPVHAGSQARQFLERHPDGVMAVRFRVDNAFHTQTQLLERNATPIDSMVECKVGGVWWRELAISTPLGDVDFAFMQHDDADTNLMPDMEPAGHFDPARNPAGLVGLDHISANVRTMMPTIAFYERVLGLSRFWDVSFHTEDLRPGVGTGLKSVVMQDVGGEDGLGQLLDI